MRSCDKDNIPPEVWWGGRGRRGREGEDNGRTGGKGWKGERNGIGEERYRG